MLSSCDMFSLLFYVLVCPRYTSVVMQVLSYFPPDLITSKPTND